MWKLINRGSFIDYEDGTIKSVFENDNKGIIEISLLFNKEDKDVVCAPTHHFCNLGCKMCHLTNKGLNKSMKAICLEDFIEALIRSVCVQKIELKKELENFKEYRRTDKKKLLISFMGVGEPLLNQKLILEVFNNSEYLKKILGYEDISFAIASMVPSINLLKSFTNMVLENSIPLKIHFSLHTPLDEARFALLPSTKATIKDVLKELDSYRNRCKSDSKIMDNYLKFHRNNNACEIHYTLIDGVNDSNEELNRLIELLKSNPITIKFIRFNPINEMKRSNNEELWYDTLKSEIGKNNVKRYAPPGKQVGSSCGEFTKHYYHEEIESEGQLKEFLRWEKEHKIDY